MTENIAQVKNNRMITINKHSVKQHDFSSSMFHNSAGKKKYYYQKLFNYLTDSSGNKPFIPLIRQGHFLQLTSGLEEISADFLEEVVVHISYFFLRCLSWSRVDTSTWFQPWISKR